MNLESDKVEGFINLNVWMWLEEWLKWQSAAQQVWGPEFKTQYYPPKTKTMYKC
jgi:hypothetical protein